MRNKDKYETIQERALHFSKFCQKRCKTCPIGYEQSLRLQGLCVLLWLEMDETETCTLKRCPLCGGVPKRKTTIGFPVSSHRIECVECGYSSKSCKTLIDAEHSWQRGEEAQRKKKEKVTKCYRFIVQ